MSKVLVTGGAGFIGSHLTEELVSLGNKVIVIDSLFSGNLKNLENVINKIEFHKLDIISQKEITHLFEGVEYVFHLAARRAVIASFENPHDYLAANIVGTFNVLEASRLNNVKKVTFASSSSVYGGVTPPSVEGVENPTLSPYAFTKKSGEDLCKFFNAQYGLKIVALRYFNVFGPRQDPKSQYAVVIPKFIYAYLTNEQPTIFGDGTHTRDFTYVKNIVNANILAVEKDIDFDIINVGGGVESSVNELSKTIAALLSKKWNPKYAPLSQKEPERASASLEKAKALLGYSPEVDLKEGIRRTIEYFTK